MEQVDEIIVRIVQLICIYSIRVIVLRLSFVREMSNRIRRL